MLLNKLPNDIIIYISTYIDCIVYRNGKFMYKIPKNDYRYELIQEIKYPLVEKDISNDIYRYSIWFTQKNSIKRHILYYEYDLITKFTYLTVHFYHSIINSSRKKIKLMGCYNKKYFFDEYCNCVEQL